VYYSVKIFAIRHITRNSAIADKPRDAFRGQSRSPNMLPFDMLGMHGFTLVCCNNVRRTGFWDIQLQKCCDLENRVNGPCRSLKMSPFDREPMTSYWWSIAIMALSRVVSKIFNDEKYRDLEIPVKSQWRSLKVISVDRLGIVPY